MSVGKKKRATKGRPSKEKVEREVCRAEKHTMVFSLANITGDDEFNFRCFESNPESANCATQLFNKLRIMSSLSWEAFWGQNKKHGPEVIPVDEFKQTFINKLPFHIGKDEKLFSVRFNGQNSRFIIKKGTKCGRVIYLVGIDYQLKLYKH